MAFPRSRPRRLRRTPALRSLVRETDLSSRHLIAPLFVKEGISEPVAIGSMPGQFQHTVESVRKEAVEIASKGVTAFMLFGVPERKDAEGSDAWNPEGIAQRAFRILREELGGDHVIIGDLCLDEYTDHGHCGVLDDEGDVDNDATLERYRRIAVAQAEAGVVVPDGDPHHATIPVAAPSSVQASEPAAQPCSTAAPSPSLRASASARAPQNASPAPVASTTSTARAGSCQVT